MRLVDVRVSWMKILKLVWSSFYRAEKQRHPDAPGEYNWSEIGKGFLAVSHILKFCEILFNSDLLVQTHDLDQKYISIIKVCCSNQPTRSPVFSAGFKNVVTNANFLKRASYKMSGNEGVFPPSPTKTRNFKI